MLIAVGNGSRVAQVSGNRRTQLEEPAPYALVGNIQTSLRKKILHIPIAQSEPGIEPNGASNDFRWKAVTFVFLQFAYSYFISSLALVRNSWCSTRWQLAHTHMRSASVVCRIPKSDSGTLW